MTGRRATPKGITAEDMPAIVTGAQMLCSSMGAATLDGTRVWVEELLRQGGPVSLITLDDLDPDAMCVTIGGVGGHAPMVELPPCGGEPELLVHALEQRIGRRIDAVASLNAAGPNALYPIGVAAATGLPLLDCDGMGRVLPLITQTTFAVAHLPIAPIAAVSVAEDVIVLDTTLERADLLLRAAMHGAGGWMLIGLYPGTAAQLREGAIQGATSRLLRLGRLMDTAHDRSSALVGLARTVGAQVLGSGQVVELLHASQSEGARHYPAMPTSVVVAEYAETGRLIRLEAQSELLLAMIDGAIAAAVPDLLLLLDRHELRVVGLESLTVGDHVDVLVVPAAAMWHSPGGLAMAGPRAFGFPVRHPGEEGQR